NGFYYDELTNKNSTAPITLRSILDLTTNSATPSINTLTTLQIERLRELKKTGKTFEQAQIESKNAVLSAFGINADAISNFNSISLLGLTLADESLLRATVALLQVAKDQSSAVEANLTVLISKLATDLRNDGQINEAAKDLVVPIQAAKNAVDAAFIRYRLQKYFGEKTNTPITKVIGVSVSPKLSSWLKVGGVLTINNVQNQLLLRDDGTVWVWPLQANSQLKQVTSVKDVVDLNKGYDWLTKENLVLTNNGTVYTINASLQATKILEDIAQIVPEAYVRADNGGVYLWSNNQKIQELPPMERLISRRGKSDWFSTTRAGIGLDGHLYFIRRLSKMAETDTFYVKDLGKHETAEAFIYTNPANTPYDSTTDFKYPALFELGQWSIADNSGDFISSQLFSKEGTLSTSFSDNTYTFDNKTVTANLVVAGDNTLWDWAVDSNTFVKRAECNGTQKLIGFNVFTTTGQLKRYYNQTSGKFCDEQVEQDITALGIMDVISDSPFIAVKKDGKLITKINGSTILEVNAR
ncbi:MAG: hypothetical protein KDI39_17855, partial [Pseudomonadales bacterium]|nr:hypothetical protein [Pseudomonadales bacterium]